MDDIDRSPVKAGQLPCKLRARRDFDFIREPADHLAEGPYLVVAVTARDHHVRRVPQRSLAAFGRSSRDRFVELLQNRSFNAHLADLKSRNHLQTRGGSNDILAPAIFR